MPGKLARAVALSLAASDPFEWKHDTCRVRLPIGCQPLPMSDLPPGAGPHRADRTSPIRPVRSDQCGQLGLESWQVRIEAGVRPVHDLIERPPSAVDELVMVGPGHRPGAGAFDGEDIPKAHVNMRNVGALACEIVTGAGNGPSDRDQQRRRSGGAEEWGVDAQLLVEFTGRRSLRCLVDVDVATGRQPQAGPAMVDEKDRAVVEVDDERVRDEMFRRRRRSSGAIDRGTAVDPGQYVGLVC